MANINYLWSKQSLNEEKKQRAQKKKNYYSDAGKGKKDSI